MPRQKAAYCGARNRTTQRTGPKTGRAAIGSRARGCRFRASSRNRDPRACYQAAMADPRDSLSELDRLRGAHPHAFEPGSPQEAQALQRFRAFFAAFAADRIDTQFDATYADDVFFNDGLKTLRGAAALKPYLRESAHAVEECEVAVEDITRTEQGEYLVRWRMRIRFKRFKRGVDTWSIGISHLRFAADGRVAYQQDYWNAADGLYEHVPLLGALIRALKRRL